MSIEVYSKTESRIINEIVVILNPCWITTGHRAITEHSAPGNRKSVVDLTKHKNTTQHNTES
jgi:hypothetical protein